MPMYPNSYAPGASYMQGYYNNSNPMSYMTQPVVQQPVSQMMPPAMPMQQSYGMGQGTPKNMEWVEGQVGAIAFQMPQGWPANFPIALWDNTKPVIYWKSWNQMGVPNQLIEIPYTMPNSNMSMLPDGNQNRGNAMSGTAQPDMSQYVTKDDLDELRKEVRNMNQSGNHYGNQNGSMNTGNGASGNNGNNGNVNNGNRGGNR